MVVFPNAKINLGLDIIARRPDGYHDIATVMVPVPWRDVLEIVPAKGPDTTLTVSGRGVDCPVEKNLVMKAYRALAAEVELPPVDIFLRKIIPDGAGLGGGSSDAAFCLVALNHLFALGYSEERLAGIAATLGADCPFFVYDRPMLCTGTGTELSPISLDLYGKTVVIVKPPVSVPTAEAYRNASPSLPATPIPALLQLPVAQWQHQLKNDFEDSVFPSHPGIAAIKESLLSMGAVYASMSGSGSSVFALFDGDILSESLSESFPSCSCFASRL